MSDFQVQPDWWLAADGRWYPPSTQPASPPVHGAPGPAYGYGSVGNGYGPPPQWPGAPYGQAPMQPAMVLVARPTVSPLLAGWLQGLFWATGAVAVIAAVLGFRAVPKFDEFWDAPVNTGIEDRAFEAWVDADDAFAAANGLSTLVWIATFVLLLVWMHKAHRATQTLGPGPRSWSQGWTIGAWFIPLAQFVLPKLVLNEIERIATAPRTAGVVNQSWRSATTSTLGWLWWITLSAGFILIAVGTGMMPTEDSVFSADEVRNSYFVHSIGLVVAAAGCALGALFVRRLSLRLTPTGIV